MLTQRPDVRVEDLVIGGAPELVIRARDGAPRPSDPVVICTAEPLACTAPTPASAALSHSPVFL